MKWLYRRTPSHQWYLISLPHLIFIIIFTSSTSVSSIFSFIPSSSSRLYSSVASPPSLSPLFRLFLHSSSCSTFASAPPLPLSTPSPKPLHPPLLPPPLPLSSSLFSPPLPPHPPSPSPSLQPPTLSPPLPLPPSCPQLLPPAPPPPQLPLSLTPSLPTPPLPLPPTPPDDDNYLTQDAISIIMILRDSCAHLAHAKRSYDMWQ